MSRMEKLFSYGTLQLETVQLEQFGRLLDGHPDTLTGYQIKDCAIQDPAVIKTSGKTIHPIACFTGHNLDEIPGVVFKVTAEEMQQADSYEVDDYQKVQCTLKSGKQTWVYVKK